MASRIAWLPLVALMGAGQALAAPAPNNQKQNQQAQNSIFPPNQPIKPYVVTGANGSQGAMRAGTYQPNAGQTGLKGSAGNNYGWIGTEPGNGAAR